MLGYSVGVGPVFLATRLCGLPKLDEYMTIKQAAEFLAVSPNTLRNWGRDGKVPMHRNPINGYRLFMRSDLDKFLQQIAESKADSGKTKRKSRWMPAH